MPHGILRTETIQNVQEKVYFFQYLKNYVPANYQQN